MKSIDLSEEFGVLAKYGAEIHFETGVHGEIYVLAVTRNGVVFDDEDVRLLRSRQWMLVKPVFDNYFWRLRVK